MQDKTPRNEQGLPHGQWEQYHKYGNLRYKGLWINGKCFGCHKSYLVNGSLSYVGNFIDNKFYGYLEEDYKSEINKEYYAR
jgi:hypothetical protein